MEKSGNQGIHKFRELEKPGEEAKRKRLKKRNRKRNKTKKAKGGKRRRRISMGKFGH